MSARTNDQFNEIIKGTLQRNIASLLEEFPDAYYVASDDKRKAHDNAAARGDGATGPIPIVFGFNAEASAHDGRKIALLWAPLFDGADVAQLTNEEWKTAFRSFREATTTIPLTRAAWRDCQLIPLVSVRQSFIPPLALPTQKPLREKILLIDHGADEGSVDDLMDVLTSEGFEMAIWSRSDRYPRSDRYNVSGDIYTPALHLHLGAHSVYDRPIRIIDSWNNGRCVIQHLSPRLERASLNRDDTITIENGIYGILTRSRDELLFALHTIEHDDALRERIISLSLLRGR
ncbi:MAG: hypothetical protein AB7U61_16110, partial [Methylocystis sp.]